MKKIILITLILCLIVFIIGIYALFFIHGHDPNFDIDGPFTALICFIILKYLFVVLIIMVIIYLLLKK